MTNNPWLRHGTVTKNPYRRTAFLVLGLSPDFKQLGDIDRRANQQKKAIRDGFDETDINAAATCLRDGLKNPPQLVAETLLVHRPAGLALDKTRLFEAIAHALSALDEGDSLPYARLIAYQQVKALIADFGDAPPFSVDRRIPPFPPIDNASH